MVEGDTSKGIGSNNLKLLPVCLWYHADDVTRIEYLCRYVSSPYYSVLELSGCCPFRLLRLILPSGLFVVFVLQSYIYPRHVGTELKLSGCRLLCLILPSGLFVIFV